MQIKTICTGINRPCPEDVVEFLKLMPDIIVTVENKKGRTDVYMDEVLIHREIAAGVARRVAELTNLRR